MKRNIASGLIILAALTAFSVVGQTTPGIIIDYPLDGSIFPPDISAPTFLWRDNSKGATSWWIEVTFADGSAPLRLKSRGDPMQVGEIDQRCVSTANKLPTLTAEQAEAHTWTPDEETWGDIKTRSVAGPATVTISGIQDQGPDEFVTRGRVQIRTSKDPVGAPIFYRDVPLMPSELQKGVIKPLAPSDLPLIAWRLRDVSQRGSRLLLEGMHTCANCHSFSLDGKTMGMDLDGPLNDKGLYTIVPVSSHISIRNEDVVEWSTFKGKLWDKVRVGFMSQISPDGQFVVTTVKPSEVDPDSVSPSRTRRLSREDFLFYVANFKDYRFLQVFYPTRGILLWYSRETGTLQALPGADDPAYVHTNAVWSPDGKYLVFARAKAKDPYPQDAKPAQFANDPNETPIQYDLYRIPFNGGKGGVAEPIAGASQNGMSNSFPKVSPDGRWIVFVQCRNGLLMRPDSQLYIIPAEGGEARRMRCNTPLMNSWHSFSPNGRWMVFSSKSRSPYTQMYLTHLDEEGNDSPAILVENTTAANRAVNIPEFVNIPPDGLVKIDAPATDFYRLVDVAAGLSGKGEHEAAIVEWKKAAELDPEDDVVQNNLAVALSSIGKVNEAIPHFEKALAVNPDSLEAHNSYGAALYGTGRVDDAVRHYEKALEIDPENSEAQGNLGVALASKGRLDDAIPHLQKALELNPDSLEALTNLGLVFMQKQQFGRAIPQFEKALVLQPDSAELHNSLGLAQLWQGNVDTAITQFKEAVRLEPDFADAHNNLGGILFYLQGNAPEALTHWRKVIELEPEAVPVLAQTAWVLSTSPETALRNGAEAVTYAERAVQLSGGQVPEFLDSLAAAYAEVGRFSAAARTARLALDLATQQENQELVAALNTRLSLYQSNVPFREQRQPPPSPPGR